MKYFYTSQKLCLLLIVGIILGLALSACGTKKDQSPSDNAVLEGDSDANQLAAEKEKKRIAELELIRQELERLREIGGRPVVKGQDNSAEIRDVDSRLAEYRAELGTNKQHKRVVSLNLYRNGLAAESRGDAEKARDFFKQAWDMDPTNVKAEKKYWEMMGLLDQDRYGEIDRDWERMKETYAAKVQFVRLQVENSFNEGVKLFEQQKYEDGLHCVI
ncbi:hypothetical protein ACFL54_08340 [Planctomycetota bacterium]